MFKQFEWLVRMVEIVFGDIQGKRPASLQEWFERNGVPKTQFEQMSTDYMLKAGSKSWEKQPTKTEDAIAALDLTFERVYGWPKGTAEKMTVRDAILALETATERKDFWKEFPDS